MAFKPANEKLVCRTERTMTNSQYVLIYRFTLTYILLIGRFTFLNRKHRLCEGWTECHTESTLTCKRGFFRKSTSVKVGDKACTKSWST